MKWLINRIMIDIRQLLWIAALFSVPLEMVCASDISIVTSHESARYQQVVSSFKDHIQQLSVDVSFEQFSMNAAEPEMKWMQQQLVAKPDLVFSLGTQATQLVLSNKVNTPAVITMVLSEQIFSQREQVSGVILKIPVEKQLAWLKRLLPDARRVAVLYDPAENAAWVERARRVAEQMDLEIFAIDIEHPSRLTMALATISRKADVLLAIPDNKVYSKKTLKTIMLTSFRNRIPLVGLSRTWVKAGALYALEANYSAVGRQCAEQAYQILQGKSQDDNRYVYPEQLDLIINQKTARHLYLDIEPELVDKASIVFR